MADASARTRWFARMVQVSLDEGILSPPQLLQYATPDVLAQHLPPEVLSRLLEVALSTGSLRPDTLLDALSPAVLAEHLPLEVLWRCVDDAAERAGIAIERVGR